MGLLHPRLDRIAGLPVHLRVERDDAVDEPLGRHAQRRPRGRAQPEEDDPPVPPLAQRAHGVLDVLEHMRVVGSPRGVLPDLRDVDDIADARAVSALAPGSAFAAELRAQALGRRARCGSRDFAERSAAGSVAIVDTLTD